MSSGRNIGILVHVALKGAGYEEHRMAHAGNPVQPGYSVGVNKGLAGMVPESVSVFHSPASDDPLGHLHEYARTLQGDPRLAGYDISIQASGANGAVLVKPKP